jgi:transposase
MNTHWTEHPYFAALDWAKEHHDVIVVDRVGTVVADFRFDHTVAGWGHFEQQMQAFGHCPVALETSCGLVVDQLLQRHYPVYPVNPKAAKRYRERKAPSGTKTDRYDAWALADALRCDGHTWLALQTQDQATATLRLLCRDEIVLIEQRTALVNQLQAALGEYYPLALNSFEDWTKPFTWAFVRSFPTAAALAQAGLRRREKFLHVHKLWRAETAPKRLSTWTQGQQLQASPATVAAKSLLALSLVAVLETLQRQIDQYRSQITQAFTQHPDHHLFGSLPGAKEKLGPRLLGEMGSRRDLFPSADRLLCLAGVSPVSYESGQIRKAHIRWACNRTLRSTVHLWANASRKTCAWAQVYYRAKRDQGHTHASALRCLGKRWLKVLWRLWQNHTPYDNSKHLDSLQHHGSFVWKALQNRLAESPAAL